MNSTIATAESAVDFIVVIPAFRPQTELIELTGGLSASGVRAIVIIDDGSGLGYTDIFLAASSWPAVHVLRHAINLGKGAALKTGINYALCTFPNTTGIVTADADGQHSVADILRVGNALREHRDALILGRREFGSSVPLRSRVGNVLTHLAVQVLVGKQVSDTQTGLRGIPAAFAARLLHITSSGYEFELEMLITAKHDGQRIVEIPIETIYLAGNKSSHFNPLRDSVKIYFSLLRFSGVSFTSAVIDNVIFLLAFRFGLGVAGSQIFGRAVAVPFNYVAARKAVFFSRRSHSETLPRYLLHVLASGLASYELMRMFIASFGWAVVPSKVLAESLLFFVNFIIQRDWVFSRSKVKEGPTDWDQYYRSVAPTARLTRKYTGSVLRRLIADFGGNRPMIVELGGANSCFIDEIRSAVNPVLYSVIDNNRLGLDLLSKRIADNGVAFHEEDVLALTTNISSDLVFSVGLIEHFDPKGTREAIVAHFRLAKPNGVVIFTFPTPTLLYRLTRAALEHFHMWKFPDERPLRRDEVYLAARQYGEVLHEEILWPLVTNTTVDGL